MKKVLIYPNTSKKDIEKATDNVINLLKKYDCMIYLPYFIDFQPDIPRVLEQNFDGDFVISLGGDGTILTVTNKCKNIPIIGINLGHVGFLTELKINEINFLEQIIEQKFEIDRRSILEVCVKRDGKEVLKEVALNDVIIKTEDSFRVMNMQIISDDTEVFSFGGDGVIIATPTGSTAYSMSAGGPIVEPDCEVMCITPICPLKFMAKSFVFSKKRVITVKMKERNNNLAYIAVDGNSPVRIYPTDDIKVKISDNYIPFIRVKNQKFYHVLNEKLGGNFNEI